MFFALWLLIENLKLYNLGDNLEHANWPWHRQIVYWIGLLSKKFSLDLCSTALSHTVDYTYGALSCHSSTNTGNPERQNGLETCAQAWILRVRVWPTFSIIRVQVLPRLVRVQNCSTSHSRRLRLPEFGVSVPTHLSRYLACLLLYLPTQLSTTVHRMILKVMILTSSRIYKRRKKII